MLREKYMTAEMQPVATVAKKRNMLRFFVANVAFVATAKSKFSRYLDFNPP